MKFYISDLHFYHKNIIKYDERPFSSVEEMNETLMKNWNNAVSLKDEVCILGDFVWGKSSKWEEILSQLNGQKELILGNHDWPMFRQSDVDFWKLRKYFSTIMDYDVIEDNGRYVVMSHYPMLYYWRDYDPNVFMLSGHLHKTNEHCSLIENVKQIRQNHINTSDNRGQIIPVECCQDYMNYTPQSLDYLIQCLDNGRIYGDK